MGPNPQEPADLVTLTEQIYNRKLVQCWAYIRTKGKFIFGIQASVIFEILITLRI